MKRVASLYLPDWPIERIVRAERAERTAALPSADASRDSDAIAQHAEYGGRREAPSDADFADGADTSDMLSSAATADQAAMGSASRVGGWRPGARWARQDDGSMRVERAERDAQIAALPAHQRPPLRELGRSSEAVEHPFKAMPPDIVRSPRRDGLSLKRRSNPPSLIEKALNLEADSKRTQYSLRTDPSRNPFVSNIRESVGTAAPLVTSIQQGSKLVIAAASPAARALGIVPGMALTQARAQVPGLDIRPADPDRDNAALLRLAILAARRWCPLVALSEGSGADTLFLDITGTAHLFGGEARMARGIVRLLARAGFTARVAVADTPGAAWALARYAPQICRPCAHTDSLAPLPIAALRLEPRAIELLKRLGIDTIGQLAAFPRAPLARRFGGSLVARLDQAMGRLPEPLDPVVPAEHIAVVQRFAEPIATADAIEHWLGRLVPALTTKLGEAGRGARMIELVADRIDGKPQLLRIGVARASRDPAHLGRLLLRRIEAIDPGFGIDALALHVRRSEPLGAEPFAERLDEDTAPDLAPLVDTLAIRIGADRLWRMAPVESDVPERSIVAMPPLDPPTRLASRLKGGDVRLLDRTAALHPWHHRWPRPVRMLRRPELLDHVIAELPDQPPRRFTWRGRTHRVIRADGPERILGEWWKRTAERDSVRDYFRVEDEAGQRFWLFRRGDGERSATGDLAWFMHGSFG